MLWSNPKIIKLTNLFISKVTMAEKSTPESLIKKEEDNFLRRLGRELDRLADEGIEFTLPAVVIDHVANTDRNLSFKKKQGLSPC